MASSAVVRSQRRAKERAVEYLGGKCSLCGYNRCLAAMDFHHLDPSEKEFKPSYVILRRKWEVAKKELDKCILVCGNCHTEIHHGMHSPEEIQGRALPRISKHCPTCDKDYETKNSKQKFCSAKCRGISQRKANRPSREELNKLINTSSWTEIGKLYGVSDNAVRKWARTHGLL